MRGRNGRGQFEAGLAAAERLRLEATQSGDEDLVGLALLFLRVLDFKHLGEYVSLLTLPVFRVADESLIEKRPPGEGAH